MCADDLVKEIEEIEKQPVEEQKMFYEVRIEKEEKKTETQILLHFNYARLCYQDGDFRKTIEILEPILLDYQSYPYTPRIISCFNLMGVATHCEAEYSVSRYYYLVALKIVQEKQEKFYYSYEYNNIALTYIAQQEYEKAEENLRLAEKYLPYSDEEMGAYIYINKTILFQRTNRMTEARQAYEICVNRFHSDKYLPDDTILCGATLFYKLGEKENYQASRKQILEKMDEMYAAEFMDVCKEMFACGLDSDDEEMLEKIMVSMDRYMSNHPQEIKVGITVADLRYALAEKRKDKDGLLKALEEKNYYKGKIIQYSEQKRVQSLKESMEINTQLQKAIESKEQAVRAKSQFLANMSHDIRTPINGIMGMLNMIRKTGNDHRRLEECLDKIEISSNHLLSLVNDVLDMAKLETDAFILNQESFELSRACAEAVALVKFQAEEAGLQVSEKHDVLDGVYVWGSELYLKKILINLFSNSIKYNKPGGSIDTSMKVLKRTPEQMVCEFRIQDTGVGMSEDFIANRLFEPFVQADASSRSSYMGTGLGMAIVKQLVDKMDGTITVESRQGEGSSFTVVLPFVIDQREYPETEEDDQDTDMTGMYFLVAEDNTLNMEIVEFLLEEAGAKTDPARDGREALEKFKASQVGTYDGILMDLMMPVMDGLTVTKKIRSLDRPDAANIPIIAMTANAFAEDAEKCMEAGMNGHLAKPLDMNKVAGTVAKLCKKTENTTCKNRDSAL